MTRVVLIRHGRSTANADGVLAGRAAGIRLDEAGRDQATRLREALASAPVAAAYSSPIERCLETAQLAGFPDPLVVEGLTECDYGRWTGLRLDELRSEAVWDTIQADPGSVTFPDGESMRDMFDRVTGVVGDLAARHADDETIVVFSHGDPIKAVLAHAFGIGIDRFQRVHVNPAGVSVIEMRDDRTLVLCVNAGGDLSDLIGSRPGHVVGGGDVARAK